MRPSAPQALGAAVLAWALLSTASTWRTQAARGVDRVGALDAEFSALARQTPGDGPVGFLRHADDPDSADHILVYYVAQYAYAPRQVVRDTGPLFLIVPNDAARPGVDERLAGFVPVAALTSGHRLYRRDTR
jgi:hypothetical protein